MSGKVPIVRNNSGIVFVSATAGAIARLYLDDTISTAAAAVTIDNGNVNNTLGGRLISTAAATAVLMVGAAYARFVHATIIGPGGSILGAGATAELQGVYVAAAPTLATAIGAATVVAGYT